MLLSLTGLSASPALAATALAGWAAVMYTQVSVRRKEAVPGFDEKVALRNRAGTIRIRTAWWCVMLAWSIAIAPHGQLDGLIALGIAMMVIDSISAMTLPHLALAAGASGGGAISLGMLARDGVDGAPMAIVAMVMAFFLHWSVYNLYYMFATRRIRTKRLNESHETIKLLLNQYDDEGSDWLYAIDANGCIRDPSQRFCAAAGMPADSLEGFPLVALCHEGHERHDLQERLDRKQPFRDIIVPLTIGGMEHWWSINGRPVEGPHGQDAGWRGFIADISAAKQAEAKVAFMAHYDLLTQLPNRTLFNATLDRAYARRTKDEMIGLLYVDLDHFKAINDGHGHHAGDFVLADVARLLEDNVRPRDMVARLGGDEFVVLMPGLHSAEEGFAVAERILAAIDRPIEVEGKLMPLGASIGIAFAPHDGSCGDDLLRAADLAMYDAKSRGRQGISVFESAMQSQALERRALEFDLRAAIAREELELHYQPQLDVKSGDTVGYEALLRWNHKNMGTVHPDIFIPIAEETGLILPIGEWVIRNALAEVASWPEHLTIAVNLSPAQLRDANLVALIVNALASSGVEPRRLELEITESLLMRESEDLLATLHSLRDIGVRIALDDFGTGYSSLNYLRSFPFDKIKIDRCFINEMADRDDCKAIVRSVIALAAELNMMVTAEGVEFGSQLDALREGGCQQVQGYLFNHAVPSAQLPFGDRQVTETLASEIGELVHFKADTRKRTVQAGPAKVVQLKKSVAQS